MKNIRCAIFLLAALWARESFSQTGSVEFSVFDMGFEVLPSQASNITSAVGQSMVDVIEERNKRIESGFITSSLLRTGIVVAVRADSAVLGQPVGVTVLLPANTQTFAESLFYRKAGEQTFSPIVMQRRGDSLTTTIPTTAVTIRGIEYFVLASSSRGSIRFPVSGVDGIRVRVDQFNSPLALTSRLYRMISVPADLNDSSALGVLLDDLGQYNPARWRLFRWEKDRNVEHPAISSRFTPGKSFWLVTQSVTGFDIDNGRSVASITPATIVLDTGWNQIASPFAFPVKWADVTATGQVSPPFYYDGVSPYKPDADRLVPWEGYFVENKAGQPVTLTVPAIEAPPVIPKTSDPDPRTGDHDFIVQLTAESDAHGVKDVYNYLGFAEHATLTDDALDLHEPPPVGDYIQLSIVEGRSFLRNYKPLTGQGQQWEVNIHSTFSDALAKVSLHQFGTLPDGFDIYILDKDEFNRVPIQDGSFTVQLRERMSVRSLRVIIGTENFAQEQSGGISLVPFEYALAQNYPNPFNPSTTIRYSLKKRSDVALEIYNMLGQRVKTLAAGEQVTGTYSVLWDGTNNAGAPVASGVYIYRLRAGDFVASRKLMLLR